MIVPGGGISLDGKRWVPSRPAFLLPVHVLGKLFRRLFLTGLLALRYKDSRRDGDARHRTMTLLVDEFIRRFLVHVLPKGFRRIRHYGLLATGHRKANIARARELLDAPVPLVTKEPRPWSDARRAPVAAGACS